MIMNNFRCNIKNSQISARGEMDGSSQDRSFSDFDETAEAVRAWDLRFTQLDRGLFRGNITQFIGNNVQFVRARFGRSLEQFGSSPRGFTTFVIPAGQSLRLFWRGQKVTGSQIMVFPQGGELYAISDPGFDVYTFSVSNGLLTRACAGSGLPDFPSLLGEKEVFHGSSETMIGLRRLCGQIHSRIKRGLSIPESPALQRELEFELPGALLTALATSLPLSTPTLPRLRRMALERSLEHIRSHRTDPVTVQDLIDTSKVSWRTLDYAFRERFNVTPKEYLSAIRLNGVRRRLRRADLSSTKIADVANYWGFWHMGQFARDYRRLFGELPSVTLKKPPEVPPKVNDTPEAWAARRA